MGGIVPMVPVSRDPAGVGDAMRWPWRRRTLVDLLQRAIERSPNYRPAPYVVLERYLVPFAHRHMN